MRPKILKGTIGGIIGAVVGIIIGLFIGMNLGGNYYGDFVFIRLSEYEAVGQIGAIIGGILGAVWIFACSDNCRTQRKRNIQITLR